MRSLQERLTTAWLGVDQHHAPRGSHHGRLFGCRPVLGRESGWVLPIRAPDAFVERLQWCDQHRKELAHMVRRIHEQFKPRDWAEVAADFESLCLKYLDGPVRKASADGR